MSAGRHSRLLWHLRGAAIRRGRVPVRYWVPGDEGTVDARCTATDCDCTADGRKVIVRVTSLSRRWTPRPRVWVVQLLEWGGEPDPDEMEGVITSLRPWWRGWAIDVPGHGVAGDG